jgi:hypothetical protein
MNQPPQALAELEITEFRERYPKMFSDPAVDESTVTLGGGKS